jgi:hypothetical protein
MAFGVQPIDRQALKNNGIHGHDHANAWPSRVPAADLKSFWGALACSCWAF